MRIKRLRIQLSSVCVALLFYINSGYAQDSSFTGVWKLKDKQQISGTVYFNAIPTIITIAELNDKYIIESKSEDLNGKEQISVDTVNLDGSSRNSNTASNRKKEIRIENIEQGKSFTRLTSFSMPGKQDSPDFTRNEIWTLSSDKKSLSLVRDFRSQFDSADKWKVKGDYERTSLEELSLNKISGKGIQFEGGMSWEDIVQKAKSENRMIFVDCYATWCRPCKLMDVNIYPVDRVGELVNSKFISLRLQMDSAKEDKDVNQELYPLAKKFARDYQVFALPSLLFFSPDGKILHKSIGEMSVNEFLATVNEALDPSKQLYTVLDHLGKGKIDSKELPALSKKMKELRVPDFYIQSYFEGLNEQDLLKKENLEFAIDFIAAIRSSDQLFKLCYKKPGGINKIMGNEIADGIVRFVITKEEITSHVDKSNKSGKAPDWSKIRNTICKKYNCNYADVLLTLAQIGFYKQKKEWKNYTKYLVAYMNVEGLEKADWWFPLNQNAWEVFIYSKDVKEMTTALSWVDKAIGLMDNNENDKNLIPGVMDTKAALFYKIGNLKEAISIYEAIVKLDSKRNGVLNKLRAGENPWIEAK